jgi:hypothetical protein
VVSTNAKVFQVTAQHELEHPATDVVEALLYVWEGEHQRAASLSDIADQCCLISYMAVHSALRNLVATGRIRAQQQRSSRAMGPKRVTKYSCVDSVLPRLISNTCVPSSGGAENQNPIKKQAI